MPSTPVPLLHGLTTHSQATAVFYYYAYWIRSTTQDITPNLPILEIWQRPDKYPAFGVQKVAVFGHDLLVSCKAHYYSVISGAAHLKVVCLLDMRFKSTAFPLLLLTATTPLPLSLPSVKLSVALLLHLSLPATCLPLRNGANLSAPSPKTNLNGNVKWTERHNESIDSVLNSVSKPSSNKTLNSRRK